MASMLERMILFVSKIVMEERSMCCCFIFGLNVEHGLMV